MTRFRTRWTCSTRLRDEVPLADAVAETRGAPSGPALAATAGKRRARPIPHGPAARGRPFSPAACPDASRARTALAVGVTAGVVALALPSGGHPPVAAAAGTARSAGTPAPDGGASSDRERLAERQARP